MLLLFVPPRCLFWSVGVLFFASSLVIAQQVSPTSGSDAEVVRSSINAVFDAMRTRDTAAVRAGFLPNGRLLSTWVQNDTSRIRTLTVDQFIRMIVDSKEPYREVMPEIGVTIDGEMAHAWGPYSFFVGDLRTNCGINSVQLFRRGGRWLVSEFGSTIVTTGCDEREARRVMVRSGDWELWGDLVTPAGGRPVPAVLMLNRANGNRRAYAPLAQALARRGIASLRLDLRGHGESTNAGRFIPGDTTTLWMPNTGDQDVEAATAFLAAQEWVDPRQIAYVGASYSGEQMMKAARRAGHVGAYVTLSPGSLSDESIDSIDSLGLKFLYIACREERHLREVNDAVRTRSRTVDMILLPGSAHATGITDQRPEVVELIAAWLAGAFGLRNESDARDERSLPH